MNEIISSFPQQWQEIIGLLLAPIAWIPRMQHVLMDFFLRSPCVWRARAWCYQAEGAALLARAAVCSAQLGPASLPVSELLMVLAFSFRHTWRYVSRPGV